MLSHRTQRDTEMPFTSGTTRHKDAPHIDTTSPEDAHHVGHMVTQYASHIGNSAIQRCPSYRAQRDLK
ncbi:hypothetical protein DPMN_108089 [Dreissena polymorpha]|uniref:Uncharacterized protein n=1 Tax=Dreissena polymorpha TaxID=45954 RepID=A0A9D4K887_DREPO|nr:hypothetical protein DPMN_108089 [Dreissena polymorpha]